MARKLPANNRSWPENLSFDFGMPVLSPAAAEAFIDSLPTNDRNKQFLLLRYREGMTYSEIAHKYGLTATGVLLALKRM